MNPFLECPVSAHEQEKGAVINSLEGGLGPFRGRVARTLVVARTSADVCSWDVTTMSAYLSTADTKRRSTCGRLRRGGSVRFCLGPVERPKADK
jgi:hypothetical protein